MIRQRAEIPNRDRRYLGVRGRRSIIWRGFGRDARICRRIRMNCRRGIRRRRLRRAAMLVVLDRRMIGGGWLCRSGVGRLSGRGRKIWLGRRLRLRLMFAAVLGGFGAGENPEQHRAGGGGKRGGLGCANMTGALGLVGAAGGFVGFGHGRLLVSARGTRG
jgi:hypothetical protein